MRLMLAVAGALCAAAISAAANAATVITFPNFSSCAGLQINGDAACTGGVLRLTPAAPGQGSAFSTTSIQLGAGASFSTFFTFRMSNVGGIGDGDGPGADGIVFVVQPVSSTVGGGGGGMGYDGIPTSVGVEFDTFNNGIGTDPNGNHVGIDLNGSVVSVQTAPVGTRMNDGNIWYAWVDYNGTVLELRLSQQATRPDAAILSYVVDLAAVLGTTQAFVGFTAGTGAGWEDQDILSWQFNSGFDPIGVIGPFSVPVLSPGLLAGAGLFLAFFGAAALRRRARAS